MNKYCVLLIECDNSKTLGSSCERDIFNIRNMLITNKVVDSNIHIFTNNIAYFQKRNITENVFLNSITNIENTMKQISIKNTPVFIHISGHGYQCRDNNMIELDGLSEQIILSSGALTDYNFKELLKKYISKDTKIRISVDTCHSGTFSNFNYQYDKNNNKNVFVKKLDIYFTDAVSISACSDAQLDSCDIGNTFGYGGGLTCHMLDNKNFNEFLLGEPIKVKNNLTPILKMLNQEPILLIDS